MSRPALRAVIGLGANLGDRLATMRAALEAIARVARVQVTSRVYATEPVGPPQPDYLNAAACVEFEGEPVELLRALLAVENELGRVRGQRFGPRIIDLDVLWIEGVTLRTPELEVPHPRLRERAFAMAPLLDVVPGARDPRSGEPYVVPATQDGQIRVTDLRL